MMRGLATFSDASGALSVLAPAGWQRRQLSFEGGPGMLVADGNPDAFPGHEHELTMSGATFVASPSLPARLGIFDARDNWFVPLMDWITREIGFFNGTGGSYGGGETWHRDSQFNGGALYGVSRIWHACGEAGRTMRDLAMVPSDASFVAYLRVIYHPSEEAIADSIVHSFEVDGAALAPLVSQRAVQAHGVASISVAGAIPSPS